MTTCKHEVPKPEPTITMPYRRYLERLAKAARDGAASIKRKPVCEKEIPKP